MNKLLNRFAWAISITLGSTFSGYFGWLISFQNIFFTIILAFLIKKFVFSSDFIEDRITYFAKMLKKDYIVNSNKLGITSKENIEEFNSEKIEQNNLEEIVEKVEYSSLEDTKKEKIDFIKTKLIKEEKIDNSIYNVASKYNKVEKKYPEEPSKINIFLENIKDFFAVNTVGKIGGILIFFLVISIFKSYSTDISNYLGNTGKFILGFLVAIICFIIGFILDKKGNKNEGLILIGISILINYSVILYGRHVLGDTMSGGNPYLSEGITFFLLILNTIFAILASLFYESKTLLIFSFIFAYLNPFIINGNTQTEPYTLLGYSFIISLGALFIGYKSNLIKNNNLLFFSFIFGNILFLIADFSDSVGWSAKLIIMAIFSIITVLILRKNLDESIYGVSNSETENKSSAIIKVFILTYVFVILNLFHSNILLPGDNFNTINIKNILSQNLSFIVYFTVLIGLFIGNLKLIKGKNSLSTEGFNPLKNEQSNLSLKILLFFPLLILLIILFSGNLIFSPIILAVTIIGYLAGFIFLQKNLSNIFTFIFFTILAIFIFGLSYNLSIDLISFKSLSMENIQIINFISVLFTAFIFLFSSYYFSSKKGLVNLFSIGTIGTILILGSIIYDKSLSFYLSVIAIIVFAIANWIMPFINNRLLKKKNFNSLIIGSLAGVGFIGFEIFNFQKESFSEMVMGFMFVGLAILYFIQAFFITQKIGVEKMQEDEDLKNIFYTFAGISISLFSIAIVFIFSKYPEIITTTWLFEATILYYFYSKNKSIKIFTGATVLFLIGLTKFGILIDKVKSEDYLFLISFSIILVSFILNLFFINKIKNKNNFGDIFHNILHLVGMGIMGLLLMKIIPSSGHGWSMLGISIFLSVLGIFYAKFNFKFLKVVFLVLITFFGIYHLGKIDYIFSILKQDKLSYLEIIQYFVSIIIISNIFIWEKINKKIFIYNKYLKISLLIYAFIASNIFIYLLFGKILNNSFGNGSAHYSLTLYWGIIATILLFRGIRIDYPKYRFIGMYFLSLTTLKIAFIDAGELGTSTAQFLVFGILGILFIIISTIYTKKYGNNILLEMKFSNFISDDNKEIKKQKKKNNFKINSELQKNNVKLEENLEKNEPIIENNLEQEIEEDKENPFMKKLTKIDVSNIRVVRFFPNKSENFTIRAKNIMRLAVGIEGNMDKNIFRPGELLETYNYVIKKYKTKLSRREYDKIRSLIKMFIDEGGRFEIVKK